MRAFIALGNPGPRYEFTRHNYGWLVADQVEDSIRIRERSNTQSYELVRASHRGSDFLICRPLTYMNHSGIAVANLMKSHKLEVTDLVVLHDDLDIPFGRIKLKVGGGHAGHKGLISIIRELGSNDFARLRLGIGCEPKPPDSVAYVLEPFDEGEVKILERTAEEAAIAVMDLVTSETNLVMNQVNRRSDD
ncbi:MAG TPA: aminoacyl-tRNA hydrolase [Acidobacteriota bacterium]|nr:aminoacyl-tRNA hydrolase [Acidobacteriota bacterium]